MKRKEISERSAKRSHLARALICLKPHSNYCLSFFYLNLCLMRLCGSNKIPFLREDIVLAISNGYKLANTSVMAKTFPNWQTHKQFHHYSSLKMTLYLFFLLLLKLSKCQISHFDIFTYQGISGSACTRVSSNSPGSNRVLGCSSDYFSSRGILYNISSNANLETFLSSSTQNKYVVLLSISLSSK